MATADKPDATNLLFGTGAMMADLKRLEAEAVSMGYLIAATLIGAAAEAVADELNMPVANTVAAEDRNNSEDLPPADPYRQIVQIPS